MTNFPRDSGEFKNPQGSGRGGSNAPPTTHDRGRGRGVLRQERGRGSTVSETVDHPISTTPTRVYAMMAHEDSDGPEVIASIFSFYDMKIYDLIDLSSTHSCVYIEHLFDKMPSAEQLEYDMPVTYILGHSINVYRVYKNSPIMIHDRKFSMDPIALLFMSMM